MNRSMANRAQSQKSCGNAPQLWRVAMMNIAPPPAARKNQQRRASRSRVSPPRQTSQAHLALESRLVFRLILRWNQISISAHFRIGKC
jgi:hypothetical protein